MDFDQVIERKTKGLVRAAKNYPREISDFGKISI